MKFGFASIPSEHYSKHIDLVRLAEDLGFDFAWVPDQTFYRDPYLMLAASTNSTEKIRLGIGVTNPNTRHPAMAARAIATLDEMAPGRIILGIGAGNNKELLKPLGLDNAHAGAKCREMAVIVRGLLSGEVIEHQGAYFQARDIGLNFESNPNIPIHIAGRGAYVLQAAGEVADGAIIGGLCTAGGIAYAVEQIKIGARKAGRDYRQVEMISWITVNVTDSRDKALEDLKPVVAHLIGGAPENVLGALALDPALIGRIKKAYIEEGIPQAAEFVDSTCIDAFSIVGDGPECVRRIKALEEAGITQISVLMPPGPVEQQKQHIKNLADKVIPAFK